MSYDEQRISDQIDGGLHQQKQQEMTQIMTKEQILESYKWLNPSAREIGLICATMEEYAQQQLSAERERAVKLIGALNEYIVLLGEELDEVMGFVNAHQWKSTRFEKGEELRQKIKQTLNEYDTATKESR